MKPTAYEAALQTDAAPFDSVPGLGFNSDPAAAAIVPPAGRMTAAGPVLIVDPAQNNAFRAINRAWKQGATVQANAGVGAPIRYTIGGCQTARRTSSSNRCARGGTHESAPGRAVRQPRLGLFQPWTGSMDEGWTPLGPRAIRLLLRSPFTPRTSNCRSRRKSTSLIIADDARVPVAGAAPRRTAVSAGGARRRPCGRSTPIS